MAEIKEVLYQHSKGLNNTQISNSLQMSRNTVRRYIKIAKSVGYVTPIDNALLDFISIKVQKLIYESKSNHKTSISLDNVQDQIKQWLTEKYITHTQINRKLKALGIEVSDRSLNRYINRHFSSLPRATIHIETISGEEAQVDYGYVGLMKDKNGIARKTNAFVMTLSHSRYRYVEFVFSQDQLSWAQSHINAFNFFGGVPKRVLLDNLKAGILKPDIYDPTLNQTYQELSHFYGFVADPAKVRKPEHKGKVEKSVHMVKQQLIAACDYFDIADANRAAHRWCKEEVSYRICRTTGETPHDLFKREDQPHLQVLPRETFDIPIWTEGKVHHDHHMVISGNFYSLPTKYITEDISVRIGLKTIRFYYDHILIKTHTRCHDKGKWITDTNDYHESAKRYLEENPENCLRKAEEMGEFTSEMITAILELGTRSALRKAQAILRLTESYPIARIESACFRAMSFDNYEYRCIANILEKGLDHKNTQSFSTKMVSSEQTAYIRNLSEYVSSMKVNF